MVARRPAASFPSPKRGMLRLVLRRPSSKKHKAAERPHRDSVPYVPPEQVTDSKQLAELRVQAWCMSLLSLMQLTERALIRHLLKIGMLQIFACCPRCKSGKLSPLRKDKSRGYDQLIPPDCPGQPHPLQQHRSNRAVGSRQCVCLWFQG